MRVLETVAPLFVMLGLGMLCRRKKIFSPDGVAALKNLAVNICLPAVLFSAFAEAEYSLSTLLVPVIIFAVCAAALGLGFVLCRAFHLRGRLSPFLATGFEAGMLGYALFALLFPGESMSAFAIVDLGQVLFVFTIYKALLNGRGGIKNAAAEALRSPVLWAIAAGVLFGASGLYALLGRAGVGKVIAGTADFIAAPTGALILLAIGYELTPGEMRWRQTAALAALRIAVMSAMLGVMLLINRYLLGGAVHTGALALLFILPPPYVLPVFADMGDERSGVTSAISALTVVSILLFAVLTLIFA